MLYTDDDWNDSYSNDSFEYDSENSNNECNEQIEQIQECPIWKRIEFEKELILENRIAGGGSGIIHEGWYKKKPVAIKLLFDPKMSKDLYDEFMSELLVMSKLSHPNIIKLIGASDMAPRLCLVMELCDCSLFDLLYKRKRTHTLTKKEKVAFCLDIANGIGYLHCNCRPPIIHRDIKSMNILYSPNGCMKICDFGIVQAKTLTAGTPNYQAPEILQNTTTGGKRLTTAVDIYAFGLVIWEIFSQTHIPFFGQNIDEIRDIVCVRQDRPNIPYLDTPMCCRNLIKNAWHQDSSKRPNIMNIMDTLYVVHGQLRIYKDTKNKTIESNSFSCGDALDNLMGEVPM